MVNVKQMKTWQSDEKILYLKMLYLFINFKKKQKSKNILCAFTIAHQGLFDFSFEAPFFSLQ